MQNNQNRVVVHIPLLRLLTGVWLFPPQVSINLGLVYKVQQHTGVIFQFLAFSKRRQRVVPEILAAGGRYDLLVRASPVCVDLLWLTARSSSSSAPSTPPPPPLCTLVNPMQHSSRNVSSCL